MTKHWLPAHLGTKKKKKICIKRTREGEAHQRDEINLPLIRLPHRRTRRCESTGSCQSLAHQLGARAPMFEVNKYNRLSGLEIGSCSLSAPHIYLPAEQKTDTHTHKKK